MYMEFAAFPIVFQQSRHWSQANSGLSFIGMAIGQILGVCYSALDNQRYRKVADRAVKGIAPPEARLIPSMIGAVLLPIGLFEFAWTNYPHIHVRTRSKLNIFRFLFPLDPFPSSVLTQPDTPS